MAPAAKASAVMALEVVLPDGTVVRGAYVVELAQLVNELRRQ